MKRLVIVALLFSAVSLQAQSVPNAGPGDQFGWNQSPATTDSQTLATVQAYVYKYYLDGAATGSVFSGVKCSGTTVPFTCQVAIPAFSNGQHSITITAANAGGESVQSSPFAFVYGNPPNSPNNIRIIRPTP